MTNDERYRRQRDIVPPERIADYKATVIGVGAIGRQVALQLAAMGVPWLQLVDFDVVETSNLASQAYLEEDLGKLKVEATAALCKRIALAQSPEHPRSFRTESDGPLHRLQDVRMDAQRPVETNHFS